MPDWNWGESQSEDGVVHQSTANTDHNDATVLKQGYDIANPYLSTDLTFFAPLHENSGDAQDFSGNGNTGTVNGATQGVTGLLGTTMYDFDGTDDYVDWGDATGTDTPNDTVTWAFWFKTTQSASSFQRLISADDGQILQLRNDGEAQSVLKNGGEIRFTWDGNYDDGKFHFAVLTADQPNDTSALYIDDMSNPVGTDIANTFSDNVKQLTFGAKPDGGGEFYNGSLAGVWRFSKALTQSERQYLYDVGATAGTWIGTAKPL